MEREEIARRMRVSIPSDQELEYYLRTEIHEKWKNRRQYTIDLPSAKTVRIRRRFDYPFAFTWWQQDDGTWVLGAMHGCHNIRGAYGGLCAYTTGYIADALRGEGMALHRTVQMAMIVDLFFTHMCHINHLFAVVLDRNGAAKRWAVQECGMAPVGVMRGCMTVWADESQNTTAFADGLVLAWQKTDGPIAWKETQLRCVQNGGAVQELPHAWQGYQPTYE